MVAGVFGVVGLNVVRVVAMDAKTEYGFAMLHVLLEMENHAVGRILNHEHVVLK